MTQIGKTLILLGILLVVAGTIVLLLQRFTGAKSFPGTLRFELGSTSVVIPILASIIGSVVLTLLLNLISKLLSR